LIFPKELYKLNHCDQRKPSSLVLWKQNLVNIGDVNGASSLLAWPSSGLSIYAEAIWQRPFHEMPAPSDANVEFTPKRLFACYEPRCFIENDDSESLDLQKSPDE
jgi:hypothetical protein